MKRLIIATALCANLGIASVVMAQKRKEQTIEGEAESGAPASAEERIAAEVQRLTDSPESLQLLVRNVAGLAETLEKNFPEEVSDGDSVFKVAGNLLESHAKHIKERRSGIYSDKAANVLVEGCSAIVIGEDGKGVGSAYVIGVNAEKGEAVLDGAPPRIAPIKHLKPVKRGHAISLSEQNKRLATFPDRKWDVRPE